MPVLRRSLAAFLFVLLCLHLPLARAQVPTVSVGMLQLAQADGGTTTVFYPTKAPESAVQRGPFALSWAADAQPARGNGRLIVISHGSGGSPWVHVDLSRVLVKRGFVVALPAHKGDNYLDDATPGPQSWLLRPAEVSRAIDAIADHPQLSSLLSLHAVGVFGGSAGGHTALSLAGGQWSPGRFREHCMRYIEQDFSSCVGFTTLLNGGWLDGLKLWVAKRVISWRFTDDTLRQDADPRVVAAIAMVPFAADFVPESLATPRIALGLVIADKDLNQVPSLHVEAIRRVCEPRCEVVMHLPDAGHGAMLSPAPPFKAGSIASKLLSDPPTFDRATSLAGLHELIADFFIRKLGLVVP